MKCYFHHVDKLVSSEDDCLSQPEVYKVYTFPYLGLMIQEMVSKSGERKPLWAQ